MSARHELEHRHMLAIATNLQYDRDEKIFMCRWRAAMLRDKVIDDCIEVNNLKKKLKKV